MEESPKPEVVETIEKETTQAKEEAAPKAKPIERWTLWISVVTIIILILQTLILFNQNGLINNQNDLFEQQNTKIDKQNDLFAKQNKRLDQQTYLQEAERRSSLVFLFNNIMDAIDKELKEDYGNDGIRNLSPQLTGRIIALSTRLEPYYYMQGDSLIDKPLSPERGQLLVGLLESQLDTTTLDKIYAKANFSYADLSGDNLDKVYMKGIRLYYADLSMTKLRNTDFRGACLINANLTNSSLEYANLNNAQLYGTNLKNAMLNNANLSESRLAKNCLTNTNFFNTNFKMTHVNKNWFSLHDKSNIVTFSTIKDKYEIVESKEHGFIRYRLQLKTEGE